MPSNFDDVFKAVNQDKQEEPEEKSSAKKPATKRKSTTKGTASKKTTAKARTSKKTPTAKSKAASPWDGLEVQKRDPTVRLNLDIKESLNDELIDRARQYRITKAELVRRLLEWGLDQAPD